MKEYLIDEIQNRLKQMPLDKIEDARTFIECLAMEQSRHILEGHPCDFMAVLADSLEELAPEYGWVVYTDQFTGRVYVDNGCCSVFIYNFMIAVHQADSRAIKCFDFMDAALKYIDLCHDKAGELME